MIYYHRITVTSKVYVIDRITEKGIMMGKIYVKDKMESALETLYVYLNNKKTLRNLATGYLSAIAIESINDLSELSFIDVFKNVFFINERLENVVTYIALFVLTGYILMTKILKRYFKNKTIESRLRRIYEKYTDPIFKGHETEGIGWGLNQTVLSCPNLQNGWGTDLIKFEVDNGLYNFEVLKKYDKALQNRNLEDEYNYYVKDEFSKRFTTDSDRLMLTCRPVALTDDNALCIKLKKVKWSQLQFFWNKILTTDIRKRYIDDFFDAGLIKYPNSFCLHLIVLTNDNKVLLTENSTNKSNDYSKTSAVSIGEQIDKEDIKNIDEDCAYYWVKRALNEELNVKEWDFNRENIHFVAINLEGDIVNYAFVCIAKLQLDSENLTDRLSTDARIDNEFKHIDFIKVDDIPKELINNTRQYHPSSKIRMIYTYLHLKGASQLKNELLKNEYGNLK